MIQIRKADERGHARFSWLQSYHSFSFGQYYDPNHMGFASLRVINEDVVAPARGFDTHPHRDMEIITYILSGSLKHKDSMGNGSVILPGDVQRMSAGTGVTHSEYNPSDMESTHLLQIWILPHSKGLAPGYEQKHFAQETKRGRWCLVASQDGREGSVSLNQDVDMYAALLHGEETLRFTPREGRALWLQVARGCLLLNGEPLVAGDGAAIAGETALELTQGEQAEVLLFDMKAD